MTEQAATIKTESEKTTPGVTGKENKMNRGDRQINHQINPKMRLPLALQKFAAHRAPARVSPGAAARRSAGDGPWAGEKNKGQKIPGPVHKLLIIIHLHKHEAKRT
jgi:hypothetical protein